MDLADEPQVLWSDASGAEDAGPCRWPQAPASSRRSRRDPALRDSTGTRSTLRPPALAGPRAGGRRPPSPLPRHERQADPRGLPGQGPERLGLAARSRHHPRRPPPPRRGPVRPRRRGTRFAGAATSRGADRCPRGPSRRRSPPGTTCSSRASRTSSSPSPRTRAPGPAALASTEIRTPPVVAGGYVVVGLRDWSVIAYALPGTLPPAPPEPPVAAPPPGR